MLCPFRGVIVLACLRELIYLESFLPLNSYDCMIELQKPVKVASYLTQNMLEGHENVSEHLLPAAWAQLSRPMKSLRFGRFIA
jgi:predicted NAD/FAD-binding protein